MNKIIKMLLPGLGAFALLIACDNKEENKVKNEFISGQDGSDVLTEEIKKPSESPVLENDFDSVLDSYEEYVDEYISFYKKAMSGDESALLEYASLLEKAEEFQTSLEVSESELNPTQLSRMLKIQQKMLDAMSN